MTADAPAKAGRREWIGLAVIALPCLAVLDGPHRAEPRACPRSAATSRPSSTQLLWIVDIYGFLVAGALITMGTLGDRIGRRRLLMIGAAAFGAASVLAAFATSAEHADRRPRAARRSAGATLAPSTMALIFNMFARPAAAQGRDRRVDRELLRRRRGRAAARRRAARVLLVGLGVPARRAGDGHAAARRAAPAARVAQPGRGPARPRQRGALARRRARGHLRRSSGRRATASAAPRRRRWRSVWRSAPCSSTGSAGSTTR